jgi:hypothetical protein
MGPRAEPRDEVEMRQRGRNVGRRVQSEVRGGIPLLKVLSREDEDLRRVL